MVSKKLMKIFYQKMLILKDTNGQGITEYGLNILFVAIALIAVLILFRGFLSSYYLDIANFLSTI